LQSTQVRIFTGHDTPLVGQAGFDEALEKGLIRVATKADIRAFEVAEAKAMG
jgi:hypothetical protein